MKNCSDKEELSRYLDGEAEGKECRRLEKHLRDCEDCRRFLAELKAGQLPLQKISRDKKIPRKPSSACLDDELIIAFLEDELPGESRGKIAAHLAECPACSRRASQARAALKTAAAVRRRGLEETPASLVRRAEEAFIRRKPSLIGSVVVHWKELFGRPDHRLSRHSPKGRYHTDQLRDDRRLVLMEEPAAFDVPEPEEDSGDVPAYRSPPKPPMKGSRGGAQRAASMRTKTIYEWTFRKPDLNLTVGFDRERSGSIFCRVSLKDARQRPVPGSPVTLIGQSSKPFRLRTNGEGIVELPVFDPGEYTLALEYPRRLRLRIEIL